VRAATLVVKEATGQMLGPATLGKQVIAWGYHGFGPTLVPAGLSGVVAIGGG
jgi:hypothetical protein